MLGLALNAVRGAAAVGRALYGAYRATGAATAIKYATKGARLAKGAAARGANKVSSATTRVGKAIDNKLYEGANKVMGKTKVQPAPAGTVQQGRPYKFINEKTGKGVSRKVAERYARFARHKRDGLVSDVKGVAGLAGTVATGKAVYDTVKDYNSSPKAVQTGASVTPPVDAGRAQAKLNSNAARKRKPAASVAATATQSASPSVSAAARKDDRPKRPSIQNGSVAAKPVASAPEQAKMPASTTAAVSAAPAAEVEPNEASIMKKYGVSNLKQLGLAVSNQERSSQPSKGAFASFQRFTEGNIDAEGSAAYNKYGEGYGKSVVAREIEAFKKKRRK